MRGDRARGARQGARRGEPLVPRFQLQFPIEQLPEYAARFGDAGDAEVLTIAAAARERGYFTRDEFRTICRWKTPRSRRFVEMNSPKAIKAATGTALRATDERERIDALRSLDGVGWPTASVFLHLAFRDLYPILDHRALHAFGVRWPTSINFDFWLAYVEAWRDLVATAGMDGRTVDQALWRWSKEQDTSPYTRSP
jgi:hypothetical protein